jgi:toxin ParE1/3/4
MADVIVSLLAQFDEAHIVRDLAKKAGHGVAVKYSDRFQNLYALLSDHPGIGSPRPSLAQHVRIGVVSPYTIPYRYDPATNTVTILRIVHGRRKLTAAMLFSDLEP